MNKPSSMPRTKRVPADPTKVIVNCQFPKKTIERLLAEAAAEQRTLSGQIRYAVERYYTNKAA